MRGIDTYAALIIGFGLMVSGAGAAPTPDATAPTEAVAKAPKRPIEAADYGRFERLGSATMSPDGRWFAYTVSRVDDEDELRLHHLATSADETIKYGERPTFSSDGAWFAYTIGAAPAAREKARESGTPLRNAMGLRNLVTGETSEVKDVGSFSFSRDGRWLVIRKSGDGGGSTIILRDLGNDVDTTFGNVGTWAWADDDSLLAMIIDAPEKSGNGVQLFDPATRVLRTLDSEDATYRALTWREDATDLAVLREIAYEKDEDVSHVVLTWRDLAGGQAQASTFDPREHETDAPPAFRIVDYAGITWADDGDGVFFGMKAWEHMPKALEAKAEAKAEAKVEARPEAKPEAKPDAKTEGASATGTEASTGAKPAPSRRRGTRPARDGRTVRPGTGVAPTTPDTVAPEATPGDTTASTVKAEDPKKEEPKNEEKKAAPKKTLRDSLKTDPSNVEVWHAKDIDIQPMQKRRANRDQRENFLASWRLDGDALVMLGNDLTERTILLDGQAHAIGLDHTPHEVDRMFGPTLNDVYVIDVASGERTPVREAVKYVLGGSPDGRHVLYQRDGDIWAYDIVAAAHRNLTGSIETEFTNVEDSTLTDEKRAHGVGGWTEDGSTVLLYDRFDIWAVPVDGSPARRLTSGADDMVRYRRVVLDREDDEFVPTDEPMIVSIFSERTKRSGYGSLGLGGRLKTLVSEDAAVGGLTKADDVDVYAYRVERYDAPTRYVLAGRDLKADRDLATSNTFIADEFLWGRGELIAYENDRGVPLLGALYYPADYDPDRTYPMIVYIYEELSDGLHRFQTPSEQSPYNTAVWSAEGYFVFQPDIVYRPQNPGLSALECLEPAVAAAVATGMIDADHVGLCGHSWGAYQTAFVVTRSDVFAAGIAGAPLTNMMSMSMSIYWNSGQTDAWIFHESQGRMDQPFWRDVDTYIDNSPIFGVDDLNTPLLIAFGDEDGAVDWNQGVEMYNAARLAGKPLVMLVYPGENHGLAKKPNQIDYHYRILEWFGHYLKGDPAPDWITRGMPHLERQKELEAASKGNARGGRGGGAPTGTPPGGRRGRGG